MSHMDNYFPYVRKIPFFVFEKMLAYFYFLFFQLSQTAQIYK